MREFKIRTFVTQPDPGRVFEVLGDFRRYPEHGTTVRSVRMIEEPGRPPRSAWEVDFRGGILRWVEEDEFDREHLAISYRQTEGDIEYFTGTWRIEPAEGGCVVDFTSRFDLGIPTMDEVLDPIAEEALHENIEAIMAGLFGPGTRTLSASGAPVVLSGVE